MSTFLATDAFINWGRWLAACPKRGCHGVETLGPEQPLLACRRCSTVSVVGWPLITVEIMDVLAHRPEFKNRNWEPGETLADLKRENRDHGLD